MFEAGVRFGENVYVAFSLNADSGDMEVYAEITNSEGETYEINGSVEWEG